MNREILRALRKGLRKVLVNSSRAARHLSLGLLEESEKAYETAVFLRFLEGKFPVLKVMKIVEVRVFCDLDS